MRKTSNRLTDGREIIYYDDPPARPRVAEDHRHLPPVAFSTELRRDPVTGAWVMYASHRQDRTFMPAAADCPLCPTTADRMTEIPESEYQVVVFENRFPALAAAGQPEPPAAGPGARAGLLAERPPAGRCEVVCYTDDHNSSFAELTPERVDLVLSALVDRTEELAREPGVEQVFCFENRGPEIGVTQPHPHGQIYAYPFVTPRTERTLASAQAYRQRCGRNLFDDVLAAERQAGPRIVKATEHWTCFVPHAARWPYELHCYPEHRAPDLAALTDAARDELPSVLLDAFGRFARLFDAPAPYIAGWHQAPVRQGRDDFAVHLELFTLRRTNDRLKYLAGSESGMDAFANDVLPEAAAARLRATLP
jgi:UDPglucose--hexose-1-phosphate uridylyltransferase